MSESETAKLWAKLDVMGRQYERLATMLDNQTEILAEVRKDVKAMAVNGCAKSATHDDHEKRLRSLEISRATATGAMAIVSAVIGFVAGIIGKRVA